MNSHTIKMYKKYQGVEIRDDGSVTSKEFNKFASDMKSCFVAEFGKRGISVVTFSRGHYDISAFVRKGDKYAYISWHCPRGELPIHLEACGVDGFLYRSAQSEKDYTGGSNRFTDFLTLFDKVGDMLN